MFGIIAVLLVVAIIAAIAAITLCILAAHQSAGGAAPCSAPEDRRTTKDPQRTR
jgi:hypothetical protein